MILERIIIVASLFVLPLLAQLFIKVTHLNKKGLLLTDLTTFFYGLALVYLTRHLKQAGILPFYFLSLSLLALIVSNGFLWKTKAFSYRRFGKYFWRVAFFISLAFYLGMVIVSFLI